MATDAEVAAKKKKVKQLREKVRVEQGKTLKGTVEADNEIKLARLDAEEARLNAELEATKELNDAKARKAALADEVDQFKTEPETPNLDNVPTDEADKENK